MRSGVDLGKHLCYNLGVVTVQDGSGRLYRLTGRVAAMVLYLARQAARLSEFDRMRLEFNCAGLAVRPKLEVCEERIEVPA